MPKPDKDRDALQLQELKARRFGFLRITSTVIHRKNGYRLVWTECDECGRVAEVLVDNLRAGHTTNCHCAPRKYATPKETRLADRYYAIQQRCTNPTSRSWKDYGARGIKNRFRSAPEFVNYVMTHMPHRDYRKVDVGRIDNNGHYEPGNIQLETRHENLLNTRRSRKNKQPLSTTS